MHVHQLQSLLDLRPNKNLSYYSYYSLNLYFAISVPKALPRCLWEFKCSGSFPFCCGESMRNSAERNTSFTCCTPRPTLPQPPPGRHRGLCINSTWFPDLLNLPTPIHHAVIPLKHRWDRSSPSSKNKCQWLSNKVQLCLTCKAIYNLVLICFPSFVYLHI